MCTDHRRGGWASLNILQPCSVVRHESGTPVADQVGAHAEGARGRRGDHDSFPTPAQLFPFFFVHDMFSSESLLQTRHLFRPAHPRGAPFHLLRSRRLVAYTQRVVGAWWSNACPVPPRNEVRCHYLAPFFLEHLSLSLSGLCHGKYYVL